MRTRRLAHVALVSLFALGALLALGFGASWSITDGTSNTGRLAAAFILPYIEQDNLYGPLSLAPLAR